ncbi:hypothetical protein BGX31_004273 [Mortierella sp. GBA43]|nr:hypothetical protein BGX31_004273 [Mortierella sp. GBA43]
MYPTLAYHTLTPLLPNSIPLFIDRVFKLSVADSHVLYALVELGLNTLDLLIRLPFETVRRRPQIQVQNKRRVSASSSSSKKYKTVVETRKHPYHGMVDGINRVIKE